MKILQSINIYNCLFLLVCLLLCSNCEKPPPVEIKEEEPTCKATLKNQKITVVAKIISGEEGTLITPDSIYNITTESAEVRTTVLQVGKCHRIIGYGHVWSSMNGTPTIENDMVKDYGANVNFGDEVNTVMTGLVLNRKYWVRSFVTIENEDSKEQKTLYNNFISDFTPRELSVNDSRNIFNIQTDKASIVITINEIMVDANIIKHGLVWSKDIDNPTLEVNTGFNTVASSLQVNQQFQINLNELLPNTKYNCRAFYEIRDIGVIYTDAFSFVTIKESKKIKNITIETGGRIFSYSFNNNEDNTFSSISALFSSGETFDCKQEYISDNEYNLICDKITRITTNSNNYFVEVESCDDGSISATHSYINNTLQRILIRKSLLDVEEIFRYENDNIKKFTQKGGSSNFEFNIDYDVEVLNPLYLNKHKYFLPSAGKIVYFSNSLPVITLFFLSKNIIRNIKLFDQEWLMLTNIVKENEEISQLDYSVGDIKIFTVKYLYY